MSKTSKVMNIPLNRVEGDLEIRIEVDNGIITKAWSSGSMYRGFEEMMRGRGALDGLVITPRVCGICSITHLTAAAEALDAITGVTPPDNSRRLRNLALMVETIQSDIRQAVLMFMVDFANKEAYKEHSLSLEALERYSPLKGRRSIDVIKETKRILQMVAIIGGQWPHTSFMVPGGVTSIPEIPKILQCKIILERFFDWYEQTFLGSSVEKFLEIKSIQELDNWLEEDPAHAESDFGFFLRFGREAGLDTIGAGCNRYLSYGNYTLPKDTSVEGIAGRLFPSGVATGITIDPFEQQRITEDTSYSWFEQEEEPLHPFSGVTKPYASGQSGKYYSWIKAPRYNSHVMETGPLAEMIIHRNPLIRDLISTHGASALSRQLARFIRPALLKETMLTWINELLEKRHRPFYRSVASIPDGQGAGLIQAARGALGHWVKIHDQKITHYQIITPSAWNGSPRDDNDTMGAWEQALVGTPIKDSTNPIEAGHVIRSFDPCLVCAVHTVEKGQKKGSLRVGPTP